MLFDDPLSYDYDYTKQKYKNIYKAVYMRWGGSAAEIVTYQLQKTLIPPLFQYFFSLWQIFWLGLQIHAHQKNIYIHAF